MEGLYVLQWYAQLLQNERLIGATINTLKVALISTLISTIIGTLMALAMERYHFRGRTGLDALLYLPIVIPEIVMALALLAFFAFSLGLSKISPASNCSLALSTVIISHIAFSISFVVVVVRASLKGFDRRLEEAAQDLGANEWQTFWRITFPLILPGIIGGALLAFTISLDDFIISLLYHRPRHLAAADRGVWQGQARRHARDQCDLDDHAGVLDGAGRSFAIRSAPAEVTR